MTLPFENESFIELSRPSPLMIAGAIVGLALTAIPMGLIAGIVISYFLIPHGFRGNHLLWVCPVVVILVYLTVCLSIRKPAKLAASVSPIEASRYETGDIAVHSHRHQRFTPIALEQAQSNSPFTDEVYIGLSHVTGVEKITNYLYLPVSNDLQSAESDAAIVGFEQEDMQLLQNCASTGTIPNYEVMASKNQLIVGKPTSFETYFGFQPKVGSFVTLKIFDGERNQEIQFEIAAILDQSKIGNNADKIDVLLLPADSMNEIAHSNLTFQYAIHVDDKSKQQAEKEIEQILTSNPRLNVRTLSAAIAQNENFLQGTKLALAVVIILIGCFAVMNLLNTILTGIIVRRMEFALMRSVGMSQKQLSTMVCCEVLITVSIGLVLSFMIGGGIGYVLCHFLKDGLMTYLNYQFPFGVTIIYCLIVILCTLGIIGVALKHQGKFTMVELLRK